MIRILAYSLCVGFLALPTACSEAGRVCVAGEDCFVPTQSCVAAVDCDASFLCVAPKCDGDLCDYDRLAADPRCPGDCVDGQCVPFLQCENGACVANGMCLSCKIGDACSDNRDCEIGLRCDASGFCGVDPCQNEVKDGDESDVDCGGPDCGACALGDDCLANTDCGTAVCDLLGSNTCEAPNTCGNGTLDAGEGCDDGEQNAGDGCDATCRKEDDQSCTADGECSSGVCDLLESNACEAADMCGNGKVETGEGCDDGANAAGDGCNAMCLSEVGGACTVDALCESGVCDLLESNTCEFADQCGNGKIEGKEACDDGARVNGDGCDAVCLIELGSDCAVDVDCGSGVCDLLGSNECETVDTCGNGKLDSSESCDDGNVTGGDGCDAACLRESGLACTADAQCMSGVCDLLGSNTCEPVNMCGNGKLESNEHCEDGNVVNGDGCDSGCKRELGQNCTADAQCGSSVCDTLDSDTCEMANTCQNGKVEGSEGCDDGNAMAGDGCDASCKKELGQSCTLDGQCASGVCDLADSQTCEMANVCQNGKVDTNEGCDDGNAINGDGCTDTCLIEDGEACTASNQCQSGLCDTTAGSSLCEAVNRCGNGLMELGEGCDDGNILDGDGCAFDCRKESGLICGADAECASGICGSGGTCDDYLEHCSDGVLSGDETDVDCGGSCSPCAGGLSCNTNRDCTSYACNANICDSAHCGDGLMSGDETGVDCGGSCTKTCVNYDCAAQTQIPLFECEKLKDLYNAADGPNWSSITNWFSNSTPCSWAGISCTAVPGNVNQISRCTTRTGTASWLARTGCI